MSTTAGNSIAAIYEIPSCFRLIPGLEDGLLPHESSFDDDEELEEEGRLFYVGMTRAIDELHFYAADTRRRGGLLDVRAASRFIDEIETTHLEIEAVEVGAGTWARGGRAVGARRGRRGGDVFPDYEGYSQEDTLLGPGTRVAHATWGEGVVVEISGVGLDAVVRVRFAGDTEKRIMVRYGKLEILDA